MSLKPNTHTDNKHQIDPHNTVSFLPKRWESSYGWDQSKLRATILKLNYRNPIHDNYIYQQSTHILECIMELSERQNIMKQHNGESFIVKQLSEIHENKILQKATQALEPLPPTLYHNQDRKVYNILVILLRGFMDGVVLCGFISPIANVEERPLNHYQIKWMITMPRKTWSKGNNRKWPFSQLKHKALCFQQYFLDLWFTKSLGKKLARFVPNKALHFNLINFYNKFLTFIWQEKIPNVEPHPSRNATTAYALHRNYFVSSHRLTAALSILNITFDHNQTLQEDHRFIGIQSWSGFWTSNGAKQILSSLSEHYDEYARNQHALHFVTLKPNTRKTMEVTHWIKSGKAIEIESSHRPELWERIERGFIAFNKGKMLFDFPLCFVFKVPKSNEPYFIPVHQIECGIHLKWDIKNREFMWIVFSESPVQIYTGDVVLCAENGIIYGCQASSIPRDTICVMPNGDPCFLLLLQKVPHSNAKPRRKLLRRRPPNFKKKLKENDDNNEQKSAAHAPSKPPNPKQKECNILNDILSGIENSRHCLESLLKRFTEIVDGNVFEFPQNIANALFCVAETHYRLHMNPQASEWYQKRNESYALSPRCLLRMGQIKMKGKTEFPNPDDLDAIMEHEAFDLFMTGYTICEDQKYQRVREEWKSYGVYELEMRAAVLCAYQLALFWIKLCNNQFNDQSLIWFQRAVNLTDKAALSGLASIQMKTDSYDLWNKQLYTHKTKTLRIFRRVHLHCLFFEYGNCLRAKVLSVLSDYGTYWYYLEHLENKGLCEENECWHDWNRKKETFVRYLTRRCMDVFSLNMDLIENKESELRIEHRHICLSHFGSFCQIVSKVYGGGNEINEAET